MLHIILPILFVVFLLLDSLILFGFWGHWILASFVQGNELIASMVIVAQFPILYSIVHLAYISPVERLKQDIAKFMTGIQEEPTIQPNALSAGMNSIISFFIKSLQILKVFKQELRDGRKLRSEVELASEIQKQTLDQEEDMKVPSLSIAMATTPATEVGGDSLDIIQGKDNNYYIYIGDVTGHGVPSGFIMMMVNALISAFSSSDANGAHILAQTNTILRPRIKQNMMMTCVMLRWDATNKKMYYTGAWHEFVLVYKKKDNKMYKIKSGGIALGMVKDSSRILKEQQIAYEPGDIIVLYTDGISEARHLSEQNGMLFGVDRIVESVMKLETKSAEMVFRQLTIDISAWLGYRYKQYDDISLVVVDYIDDGKESETLLNIQDKIDYSYITEWNWWKKSPKAS